jgi:hypothetical protein
MQALTSIIVVANIYLGLNVKAGAQYEFRKKYFFTIWVISRTLKAERLTLNANYRTGGVPSTPKLRGNSECIEGSPEDVFAFSVKL